MFFSKKASRKRNSLLNRLVEVFLTTGVIAMPWVAQASEIVRNDGVTGRDINGVGKHDVYAGRELNPNVGASRFAKFNVTQGDIVNMHMKMENGAKTYNTLVNFVDSRININGTVNAIKDAKIGGNLYFLSADGMAVGKSGVINAGSLHVMTPTHKWMQDNGNVNISNSALNKVLIDEVPINEDGTVVVMGTVNAVDNITVKAGKINIGVSEDGSDFNPAKMTTGTTDFAGLVNVEDVDSGLDTSGDKLKMVKTGNGDIIIAALAKGADNSNKDNLAAIVKVDGGSEINARDGGMVSVTATATREADDKFDLESLVDNIVDLNILTGTFDTGHHDKSITIARVEIGENNTIATAQGSVEIKATAKNTYSANIPVGVDMGTKALNMLTDLALSGFGFTHAGITNEATVTIGKSTNITASGNIDVKAEAKSSAELDVGSLSLYLASKIFPNASFSPSAIINIMESNNTALVNVQGDLTSTGVGNISLVADANNTVHSTASGGLFGGALVEGAIGGFGFNLVFGSNVADVLVGNDSDITAQVGNIAVKADAVTSMIMKTDITASSDGLATFTFNYMDYGNYANVTVDGNLTTVNYGDIDILANAKYTDNTMVGDSSAGLGSILSPIMNKLEDLLDDVTETISGAVGDAVANKFSNWVYGTEGSAPSGDAFILFALDQVGLKLPDLPGMDMAGETIVDELSSKLGLGVSMGFMYQSNEANITLGSAAEVVAKDKLTVNAVAKMDDLHTAVYGTATASVDSIAGSAAGAFLKRDFTNTSNITVDSGTEAQHAVLEGAEIDIDATSYIPYNRINKMIEAVKDQVALISGKVKTMDMSNLTPLQQRILNKYLADVEEERAKLEADLYKVDEDGNLTNELKDEFCEGEQGYARMSERVDAFEGSEAYVKYNKLITTGKYDAGTFEDGTKFAAGNMAGDKTNWEDKAGGFFDLIGNAVDFVKPSSYVNFFVGSSNTSTAITDLFSGWGSEGGTSATNLYAEAGISLGIDNATNQAQVLIGRNAHIKATDSAKEGVGVFAYADFDNISALYSASLFAKAMGLGMNVSLLFNELNNSTYIAVAEQAEIESANDIYVNVDSETQNVGVNFGAAKSENAIAAAVVLLNTEGNSIVSVDDEVNMNALNDIYLTGYNDSLTVAVSGSLAWGTGNGAGGLALGLSNLNRANIVAIADNDEIFKYYGTEVFAENDDDTVRMRKVLANRLFKTKEQVQDFFGEKQEHEIKGTIKAKNLYVNAVSDGTTVNVDADVADPPEDKEYTWEKVLVEEKDVDVRQAYFAIKISDADYKKYYDKATGKLRDPSAYHYEYSGKGSKRTKTKVLNWVTGGGANVVKFYEAGETLADGSHILITKTSLQTSFSSSRDAFKVPTKEELLKATGAGQVVVNNPGGDSHKNYLAFNGSVKRYQWIKKEKEKPTTSQPPTTSETKPPDTTTPTDTETKPPTTSETKPPTTSEPPTTTSQQPPTTTSQPPTTTSQPPQTTTQPPQTTTQPPQTTTSQPPQTTTEPPPPTTSNTPTITNPPTTTEVPTLPPIQVETPEPIKPPDDTPTPTDDGSGITEPEGGFDITLFSIDKTDKTEEEKESSITLSMALAASIGINTVVTSTASVIDNVYITLGDRSNITEDVDLHSANNKLNVHALDESLILAVSGGVAKTSAKYGGSDNKAKSTTALSFALQGGAGENDVYSNVTSYIGNSTILGADDIVNQADRKGAIAAAAAAIAVQTANSSKAGSSSIGVAGGAGVSINEVHGDVKAIMKNNRVNVLEDGTIVSNLTNLTNLATSNELQITGAIAVDVSVGKSQNDNSVGLGAGVSVGKIYNTVLSEVDGGYYAEMDDVVVDAITDLTQISAGISFGLAKGKAAITLEAVANIASTNNDIRARINNAEIIANALDVRAYDTNLDKNMYSDVLSSTYGLESTGDTYREYSRNSAEEGDFSDSGNLIINAGVEIGISLSSAGDNGTGVEFGAVVLTNDFNNDFTSTIDNSTITLKSDSDKLKVLAESSSLIIGVALGGNGGKGGAAIGANVIVNKFYDDVYAGVNNSVIDASELDVESTSKAKIIDITAGVNVNGVAIGAGVIYSVLDNSTVAYLNNTDVFNRNNLDNTLYDTAVLDVYAHDKMDVFTIALGASGSTGTKSGGGGVAINGEVAINMGRNDVQAFVQGKDDSKLINLQTLNVKAEDDSYIVAVAGAVEAGKGCGIGGTVALNWLGRYDAGSSDGITLNDGKKQSLFAAIDGYDISMAADGTISVIASNDDADLKTVSVGTAIEGGAVAFQGAYANTDLNVDTVVQMLDNKVTAFEDGTNYTISLDAYSDSQVITTSIVAAIAFSSGNNNSYVAMGCGLAQNKLNADTYTIIAGGEYTGLKDLKLKSQSNVDLTNATIGAAGGQTTVTLAGSWAHNVIDNDTVTQIGYADSTKNTKIAADGDIGVISLSNDDIHNYVGSVTASFASSTGVSVGIGAAVSQNDIFSDTTARTMNADIISLGNGAGITARNSNNEADSSTVHHGLTVVSDAYHQLYNASFTGGVSYSSKVGVAIDGVAAFDKLYGTTDAEVYATNYNEGYDTEDKVGEDIYVRSTDEINTDEITTNAIVNITMPGASLVGVSIGAGITVLKDERTVKAAIDGGDTDKVINADNVTVLADSNLDARIVNTAATITVTGTVGVGAAGNVTLADMTNSHTIALLKNVKTTTNKLDVTSNHNEDIQVNANTAVATISISNSPISISVSIAATVVELDCNSLTEATVADSNIYHYSDGTGIDNITAKGDSDVSTQSCNVAVAVPIPTGPSGLPIGVAVGVLLTDVNNNARTDANITGSTIGTESIRAKKVDVLSQNTVHNKFNNANANASVAAVGVGISINTIQSGTFADVLGSEIYSIGDIDVNAVENVTIDGQIVATTIGALAVNVSMAHNYIGCDAGEQDNEFLSIVGGATGSLKSGGTATFEKGAKVNLVNSKLHTQGKINAKVTKNVTEDLDYVGVVVGLIGVGVSANDMQAEGNAGVNITGSTLDAVKGIDIASTLDGELSSNSTTVTVGAVAVDVALVKVQKVGDANNIIISDSNLTVADGDITVNANDSVDIYNVITHASIGLLTGSGYDLTSVDYAKNNITIEGDSNLNAANVKINVYDDSLVSARTAGGSASLVAATASLVHADSRVQNNVNIRGNANFTTNKVDINSTLATKAKSDVLSLPIAVASVGVNMSTSDLHTESNVNIVGIDLGENTDLKVVSANNSSIDTTVISISGSILGSSSNFAKTEIDRKSTITMTGKTGSEVANYKNIDLDATTGGTVVARAENDSGSIIDASPYAAKAVSNVTDSSVITFNGNIDVAGSLNADAGHDSDHHYNVNSSSFTVLGGNGLELEMKHLIENSEVTFNNAKLNVTGNIAVKATTDIGVNPDDRKAVQSTGYSAGVLSANTASIFAKDITINDTVNFNNSEIHGKRKIDIASASDGNIHLSNYVHNTSCMTLAAAASNCSDVVANTNNKINIKDSLISAECITYGVNKNMTMSTSDSLNLVVHSYVEATGASIAGVTIPKAYCTLNRSNVINFESGALFGAGNMNLYAGKDVTGVVGDLNLDIQSESFTGSLISVAISPTLEKNITQSNQIIFGEDAVARVVRNAEMYAENGFDSVRTVAMSHSIHTEGDDNFVSTANGGSFGADYVRNNFVQMDGLLEAGLINHIDITIGEPGNIIILNDDNRGAIQNAYDNKTIYSEDDRDKFIFLDEKTQEAFGYLNLTLDDFAFGTEVKAANASARIQELNIVIETLTATEGDPELIADLKSERDFLMEATGHAVKEGSASADGFSSNEYDYISIPNLVVSGGNVNITALNDDGLRGKGRIIANGSPTAKITNQSNLTLIVNDIDMQETGGNVVYNLLNLTEPTYNTTLGITSAAGQSGSVQIDGRYSGNTVKFDFVDPEDGTHNSGSFTPVSDVIVRGTIYNSTGNVRIESKYGDICVDGEGWKEDGDADLVYNKGGSVVAKEIMLVATNGSVIQGYTPGIRSIGGDIQAIYKELFEQYYNMTLKKGTTSISMYEAGGENTGVFSSNTGEMITLDTLEKMKNDAYSGVYFGTGAWNMNPLNKKAYGTMYLFYLLARTFDIKYYGSQAGIEFGVQVDGADLYGRLMGYALYGGYWRDTLNTKMPSFFNKMMDYNVAKFLLEDNLENGLEFSNAYFSSVQSNSADFKSNSNFVNMEVALFGENAKSLDKYNEFAKAGNGNATIEAPKKDFMSGRDPDVYYFGINEDTLNALMNLINDDGSINVEAFNNKFSNIISTQQKALGYEPFDLIRAAIVKAATTYNNNFVEAGEPTTIEKASSPRGGTIAGSEVFIQAENININGVIQSGFSDYYSVLEDNDVNKNRIAEIENLYNSKDIQEFIDDDDIRGNDNYLVQNGTAVWNEEAGRFDKELSVYYNPYSNCLVYENADANGGKIYLTGRIGSTGDGKILCMNGAYNINVENKIDEVNGNKIDIAMGNLIVNDVHGVISINEVKANSSVLCITADNIGSSGLFVGDDGKYYYTPEEGLRYSWAEEYTATFYDKFSYTTQDKWWGAKKDDSPSQAQMASWSTDAVALGSKDSGELEEGLKVYVVSVDDEHKDDYILLNHNKTDLSNWVYVRESTRDWTSGLFGCHKNHEEIFRRERGSKFTNRMSVAADIPIEVSMFGYDADVAGVYIKTINDLTLKSNIGNAKVYSDGSVKGTVSLTTTKGSIYNGGGNIYGKYINMFANNTIGTDAASMTVFTGNNSELNAVVSGENSSVYVEVNGAAGTEGNVELGYIGGDKASHVEILAPTSITQMENGWVKGNRVEMNAANGSITGYEGGRLVMYSGDDGDAIPSDTLSASVTLNAYGDIKIEERKGNLRVNKIHSISGDLDIYASDGGIVDAMPRETNTNSKYSEDELVAKWKDLGLIRESPDQKTKQEIENEEYAQKLREEIADYKTTTEQQYENYLALVEAKAAYDADKEHAVALTDEELYNLDVYAAKFHDEHGNLYANADEYLATDVRYAEIQQILERVENVDPVTLTKEMLLYSISDSLVNPKAGVTESTKEANLYGRNITLKSKESLGVNSDIKTVIDITTLDANTAEGLEALKALSMADASNVEWDAANGKATITNRLAVGFQNRNGGVLTVETTEDGKDIYLETRKRTELETSGNYDMNIDSIKATGGEVVLNVWGSIQNGAQDITTANITAKDAVVNAGRNGSTTYDIGSVEKPLELDLTGGLQATATRDIFVDTVDGQDLHIYTMNANRNINISSSGSIYSLDRSGYSVQGHISTNNAGIITLNAADNIGDETNYVRILNSNNYSKEAGQGLIRLYAGGKYITVEGVSTATPTGLVNDDGVLMQKAGGTFALDDVVFGTCLKLVVNGDINLLTGYENATGSIEIVSGNNLTIEGNPKLVSKLISFTTAGDIVLKDGSFEAEKVVLNAGKTDAAKLTYGTAMYDNLANGSVTETDKFTVKAEEMYVDAKDDVTMWTGKNSVENAYLNTYRGSVGYKNVGTEAVNLTISNNESAIGQIQGIVQVESESTVNLKKGIYTKGNITFNVDGRLEAVEGANIDTETGNLVIKAKKGATLNDIAVGEFNATKAHNIDIIAESGDISIKDIFARGDALDDDIQVFITNNGYNKETGEYGTGEGNIEFSNMFVPSSENTRVLFHTNGSVKQNGNISGDFKVNADVLTSDDVVKSNNLLALIQRTPGSENYGYGKVEMFAADGITLNTLVTSNNIDLNSSNGEVQILGSLASNAKVNIKANAGVKAADKYTYQLSSGEAAEVNNDIVSEGNINIQADNGSLILNGFIISTASNVQLTADENITTNNTVTGVKVDVIAEKDVALNKSVTATAGDINVIANNGSIATGADGSLSAENVILNAKGDVNLNAVANAITNMEVAAENGISFTKALTAGTDMNLAAVNGDILGGADLKATAGNVTVDNTKGDVTLNGAVTAGKTVGITGTEGNITTKAVEGTEVTMTAGEGMNLNGAVKATAGDITANATDGFITTDAQGTLDATNIKLDAKTDVTLNAVANAITNMEVAAENGISFTKALTAGTDMNLAAVNGDILGGADLKATAGNVTVDNTKGDVTLNGAVTAGKTVGITGTEGNITTKAVEGTEVTMTAGEGMNLNGAVKATAGDITANATNGFITTDAQGTLDATNIKLDAKTNVSLAAVADADKEIKITAGNNVEFTKDLTADTQDVVIETKEGKVRGVGGKVTATEGSIVINTNTELSELVAADETGVYIDDELIGSKDIRVDAKGGNIEITGEITANDVVSITNTVGDITVGKIDPDDIKVIAEDGNVTLTGLVEANKKIEITSRNGNITANSGADIKCYDGSIDIQAAQEITLQNVYIRGSYGNANRVDINISNDNNISTGTGAGAGDITIEKTYAPRSAETTMTVRTNGKFTHNGELTGNDISVTAGSDIDLNGAPSIEGNMTLNSNGTVTLATDVLCESVDIQSGGDMEIAHNIYAVKNGLSKTPGATVYELNIVTKTGNVQVNEIHAGGTPETYTPTMIGSNDSDRHVNIHTDGKLTFETGNTIIGRDTELFAKNEVKVEGELEITRNAVISSETGAVELNDDITTGGLIAIRTATEMDYSSIKLSANTVTLYTEDPTAQIKIGDITANNLVLAGNGIIDMSKVTTMGGGTTGLILTGAGGTQGGAFVLNYGDVGSKPSITYANVENLEINTNGKNTISIDMFDIANELVINNGDSQTVIANKDAASRTHSGSTTTTTAYAPLVNDIEERLNNHISTGADSEFIVDNGGTGKLNFNQLFGGTAESRKATAAKYSSGKPSIANLYETKDDFTYTLIINDMTRVLGTPEGTIVKIGNMEINLEGDVASAVVKLLQTTKLEYDIDEIDDVVIYGFGRKFLMGSDKIDEEEFKKLVKIVKDSKNKKYTKKNRYQF